MDYLTTLVGDCRETLKTLDSGSVQMCVTSPPYFNLRNYNAEGQIGLESTPDEYVVEMVKVFQEVRRVLKDDGTLWLNLGSTYANSGDLQPHTGQRADRDQSAMGFDRSHIRFDGYKPKDLIPIPWLVAMALQQDGYYLRQDIIWNKPNPMPESVTDRCTKAHEYIFLLSKSQKYFYDAEAIAEPSSGVTGGGFSVKTANAQLNHGAMTLSRPIDSGTRNKRSVWTVPTAPFSEYSETYHWQLLEGDEPSYGNLHIASLNCPIYGGLFDLLANALCDEPEGDSLTHTLRNCKNLAQEPKDGFLPIDQLRAWRFGSQSLDSLLLSRFGLANQHSNQTHKTGLYVSTSLACTPSAQRTSHIERTLAKHGWSVPYLDNLLSNTTAGDCGDGQKIQSLWSIVDSERLQDFFLACGSFYQKTAKKTSHFATFPPDLVRPCILAGSRAGDTVLDPFMGSGTTAKVAIELGRKAIGCELNPEYVKLIEQRATTTIGFAFD